MSLSVLLALEIAYFVAALVNTAANFSHHSVVWPTEESGNTGCYSAG